MMKKGFIYIICMFWGLQLSAQTENSSKVDNTSVSGGYSPTIILSNPEMKVSRRSGSNSNVDVNTEGISASRGDDGRYPNILPADTTYYLHDRYSHLGYYPGRYGLGMWGYGMPWGLHKGLNLSLDASVFGFFGSGAPKGVGFGQRLTALYVAPINDRLTAIVGGYLNNTIFSGSTYREGGIYGELSYKFDEHWEASIYGQKSLINNDARRFMPHYMYDLNRMGDRIGGSVRYNFSPSFSVQLNVEYEKRPAWELPPPPPGQRKAADR